MSKCTSFGLFSEILLKLWVLFRLSITFLFLGLVDKFGDLVDTGKIIEFVAADSEDKGLLGKVFFYKMQYSCIVFRSTSKHSTAVLIEDAFHLY